jgi:hypothetical protein
LEQVLTFGTPANGENQRVGLLLRYHIGAGPGVGFYIRGYVEQFNNRLYDLGTQAGKLAVPGVIVRRKLLGYDLERLRPGKAAGQKEQAGNHYEVPAVNYSLEWQHLVRHTV